MDRRWLMEPLYVGVSTLTVKLFEEAGERHRYPDAGEGFWPSLQAVVK